MQLCTFVEKINALGKKCFFYITKCCFFRGKYLYFLLLMSNLAWRQCFTVTVVCGDAAQRYVSDSVVNQVSQKCSTKIKLCVLIRVLCSTDHGILFKKKKTWSYTFKITGCQ